MASIIKLTLQYSSKLLFTKWLYKKNDIPESSSSDIEFISRNDQIGLILSLKSIKTLI